MQYSQLKVTKISHRKWKLLEDWETPFGLVPKGFISNGANVPRIFWAVMSPAGRLFEASILHDYLYIVGIRTKKWSDLAFKRTAIAFGLGRVKATIAYYAVYLFGRSNH